MAYEQVVQGGASVTQGYGCTSWGCANHSEWNCPGRGCNCLYGFHAGIDLAQAPGRTPLLLAVGYGRVIQIGRLGGYCGGLGAQAVGIISGNVTIWYGHCSQALVKAGDLVRPGLPVGRMGSLGCSTGLHVHFEVGPVGYTSGCSSVNPAPYLTAWPGVKPPDPPPPPPPPPPPEPEPTPATKAAPWALLAGGALVLYAAGRRR